MDTVLGLLGMIVYIVGVISFAAGITWLVVKISPAKKPKPAEPPAEPA